MQKFTNRVGKRGSAGNNGPAGKDFFTGVVWHDIFWMYTFTIKNKVRLYLCFKGTQSTWFIWEEAEECTYFLHLATSASHGSEYFTAKS